MTLGSMKYCWYIWYNDRIEVSCVCCLFPDDYWLGGLLSPVKASDVPTAAYTCNICGTSYKQRSSLKQHMDVHLNNTKCPICNLTLSRKVDVRRHKKIVHKIFWAVVYYYYYYFIMLLLAGNKFSLGGSSAYTCTDKTYKDKYT